MSSRSKTLELPPFTHVDPADEKSIAKCTETIGVALGPEPICIALILDIDGLPPGTPRDAVTRDRLCSHFADKVQRNTKAGAIAAQAGNFSAVAIWEPPNFSVKNEPNNRQCSLLEEWKVRIAKVEAEHLGERKDGVIVRDPTTGHAKLRPYWHLNYLVRNAEIPSVPGAISAVVRPFLERARQDGVPVWLEASTLYSASIYEHYGFRMIEKVTIGAGRYGADGWPMLGGEGVSAWAMIYDKHLE